MSVLEIRTPAVASLKMIPIRIFVANDRFSNSHCIVSGTADVQMFSLECLKSGHPPAFSRTLHVFMSDIKAQLEALSSVNMTASSLKFLVTEVNLAVC